MPRSMTGFGNARGQAEGVEYDVEVRAVNNRYLKTVIKLPDVWSSAESEVEKRLRKHVDRGSVTLSLRMRLGDEQAAYRVNTAAVRRYVEQLKAVEVEANPTLRIDLGSLLQLPGVCEPPPLDELCQASRAKLMELIDEAIAGLVAMREHEGQELAEDLLANCAALEEHLATVTERAPGVVANYHEKLCQRVAELTDSGQAEVDDDILAREVAFFADRCDIAEEISRLSGHMELFRQTLATNEAAGRKLDFIAQEMLRETNTIGSKANDTQIARAVVEMKTAIDRIKEQVQNVE